MKKINNQKKNLQIERQKIGSWGHIVKERLNAVYNYSGLRVLDAGCSNGAYVNVLRKSSYDAYGIDILNDKNWKSPFFQIGNICHMPYKDNAFDTVIAFEVLEHVEDITTALNELYRITKNNIIISVPNCSQPDIFKLSGLAYHHWIDRTHVQFFTKNSLEVLLNQNGFSVNFVKKINPVIPEILFLSCYHIPMVIIRLISKLAEILPFRKKYYMTLLLVASKQHNI